MPQNPNRVRDEAQELFSLIEVARKCGLAYGTVWTAVKSGRIPAVRVGRTWRVSKATLASISAYGMLPAGSLGPAMS